ncbi:homoserine acetyltransferase [Clavulina sp. PMI_390]|nr:homoserine acetyltransferase [Clavulina sp. PMI_390]
MSAMRSLRTSASLLKIVQRTAGTRSIATARPVRASVATSSTSPNAAAETTAAVPPTSPIFPCVDSHSDREERILQSMAQAGAPSGPVITSAASKDPSTSGPEPAYGRPNPSQYKRFHYKEPFPLIYSPSNPLPQFDIAYETWGTMNATKSNVILLHTGLSASSHAASTELNPAPGWWEKFIGPGKALDTDQFFIICTNVLGGCYGSTGPSSHNPAAGDADGLGSEYGTNFPVLSIWDIVRAQWKLIDHLGIEKLYASVGSSMGGMSSLAAAWLHPDRVGKIASISGTARSSPSSIAMRYAQRSVLMADPNWNRGFYYDGLPPHTGMKLARQIATFTYRSGPEWDQRFGRNFRTDSANSRKAAAAEINPATGRPDPRAPMLCPDFLIETYLDHQGEAFCLKYDANSLIYVSKAMDLFDMTKEALDELGVEPTYGTAAAISSSSGTPIEETPVRKGRTEPAPHLQAPYLTSLAAGLKPLESIPTLVLGVQSDILFPVDQQRELSAALKMAGNTNVSYYELGGVWGHDTFLIDIGNVGGALRGFLSLERNGNGNGSY